MTYHATLKTIQEYLANNTSSSRYIHFKKQLWYSEYQTLYLDMKFPQVKTERNRFYLFERNLLSEPKCKMCSNKLRWYPNFGKYAKIYCGSDCKNTDDDYRKILSDHMQNKWDTASDVDMENHKKNTMTGLCKAYGVDNNEDYAKARQIEWMSDAIEFLKKKNLYSDTMTPIEIKAIWGRYFGDIILNRTVEEKQVTLDQRFGTNLERYGSIGTLGDIVVQAKYKATNMERRGVEYVMQDPAVFEKAYRKRCKKKDYTMPSGVVIRVQGYEPWALDKLVKQYVESDITVADASFNISWVDTEGQSRVFYPDIYVKSEHRIVEVKSTYTWEKYESVNWQKKKACVEQGFECQFWVFDGKGNLEIK
jgi:hypothetical protein